MITKRIIPCLDVKDGRVVKGVKFEGLSDVSSPVELGKYYSDCGADELVFYDITASAEGRALFTDILTEVAQNIFIPLTVGGGINTLADFDRVLKCGADKVSVNSGALKDPGLIPAAAQRYGDQCVVLSADVKRVNGQFRVFAKGGREDTGRDALDWIRWCVDHGAGEICLVVGYKYEIVRENISHKDVKFVLQEQQLGTGHAVRCAKDFLGEEGQTLILFGDTPLITAETLKKLREHHIARGNTVTVLSAMVEDPTGYGRIIRDADGNFVKSVEHKDATEVELASHEINSGMYIFDTKELREALDLIQPNNAQGEYYLPDTLTIIKEKGLKVDAYALDAPEDITGVNDQEQLAAAAVVIRRRIAGNKAKNRR